MNRELAQAFPHVYCELDFTNPLELTVATILSAQSTDKGVNLTTPALFKKYRTALDYAQADRTELEEMIRPTGFYRNKANSLIRLGQELVERFDGAGARHHGGARHAARRRPQNRQRHSRQRLRYPRYHRRHPLRQAGSPLAMDRGGGPGQGRARGR